LTIDIDHIGDREMTRAFQHTSAAFAALLLTFSAFVTVVTVPSAQAATVAVAAPVLA
jgi:hypothetical protein